jgi:hypothetical protein
VLCTQREGMACGYLLCKNSLLSCPVCCVVDVGGLLLVMMDPRTLAVNAKTSVVYRLLYTLPGLPPPVRSPAPSVPHTRLVYLCIDGYFGHLACNMFFDYYSSAQPTHTYAKHIFCGTPFKTASSCIVTDVVNVHFIWQQFL